MGTTKVVLYSIMVVLVGMSHALSFQITAPAFLWSSHQQGSSYDEKVVDYRTISQKDLVKSVISEGGWSNVVCYGENLDHNADVALIFVGRQLQSSDISSPKEQDSSLLDALKLSFTSSNFSIVFPYVAIPDEKETLENSLLSAFEQTCRLGLGVNQIAYTESCSVKGENLKKLQGLESVHDFIHSRVGGKTDLIFFCSGASEELHITQSEGEVLSGLVNLLKQSGATHTILYTSNPYRSVQYRSRLASRLLAEGTQSNNALNLTSCDGVCQIKTSLLEGLFVAVVLLIILISGLCCMMGIDTPTRFETPQES